MVALAVALSGSCPWDIIFTELVARSCEAHRLPPPSKKFWPIRMRDWFSNGSGTLVDKSYLPGQLRHSCKLSSSRFILLKERESKSVPTFFCSKKIVTRLVWAHGLFLMTSQMRYSDAQLHTLESIRKIKQKAIELKTVIAFFLNLEKARCH